MMNSIVFSLLMGISGAAPFTQFSLRGGILSHVSAETPGSINEGGELGSFLMHAYGAAFDNVGRLRCGRRRS